MTTSKSPATDVVVVDGSNIATEGRSIPSLSQLNDAVLAFREEFPDATVTVVVDATFGHRIDKSELAEFDAAVAHNEVVAPPAGAIGRGDAFVLSIAGKVGARILSNDSFQEFHGTSPWLFDEGRLIGGKPVPYVGWVFVERLPVKGPTSRKSQRDARTPRESPAGRRTASKAASQPMPVPSAPPPGPARSGRRREAAPPAAVMAVSAAAIATATAPSKTSVNDLLPFIDFVEHHPIGSSVNGVVESYSSHGAYVSIGDLSGYVPLRLMSDPPPRSAREVMRVGDAVTLVVTSFAPARRSVDLAVPNLAPDGVPVVEIVESPEDQGAPKQQGSRRKRAAVAEPVVTAESVATPRKRGAAKRAGALEAPADDQPAVAPTKRGSRKRVAATEPAPAKKTNAKSVEKEPAAKKKAAPDKTAATKKASATKAPATKKSATKASAAKRSTAEKSTAATTKKQVAPAAAAAKTSVRKSAANTAPAEAAATSPADSSGSSRRSRRSSSRAAP